MSSFKLDEPFIKEYSKKSPDFGFNGLGELVYLRTYSRLKPDSNNEKWYETIQRVVEGTYNLQKEHIDSLSLGWNDEQAQQSAQEMYTRMFEMKFLPPGRGLWAMGSDIITKKGLAASLNNCGFISTKDIGIDGNLFSTPFIFLMDMSMLGVGVGFDTEGEGNFIIKIKQICTFKNHVIEDTREGWVESVKVLLDSYNNGSPVIFDYSKIRPAGVALKTFGGLSSGPAPLIELHKKLVSILTNNIDKPITLTTIVDIMNLIGKCVVAGNIRRCLPIGTLVHTLEGLIPIEKVCPGTQVYTSSGIAETVDYVFQGLQQLYTINTELGEFKCTRMHKMAVLDLNSETKYSWRPACELELSDRLIFPVHKVKGLPQMIAFDNQSFYLNEKMAATIGYLNGIGYSAVKHPHQSKEVITDEIFESLGYSRTASTLEQNFINHFTKDQEISVSNYILMGTESIREAYLNGVIQGMGRIINTEYHLFAKQLQALYASLGIPAGLTILERNLTFKINSLRYLLNPIDHVDPIGNIIPIRIFSFVDNNLDVKETYDISVKDTPEFIAGEGLLVHNTAEIAFGKMDSEEFMDLKDYSKNPHRMDYGWTSNNSIFAELGMDYSNVSKRIKLNGEPGIAWLENMRNYSRMVDPPDNKDYRVMGGNPCLEQSLESYELCCVTADTRIQTRNGCPKIINTIGIPVEVWNGRDWSKVTPFMASKMSTIYRVEISDGSYLDCTENHKWSINDAEVETKELKVGDPLPYFNLGPITGHVVTYFDHTNIVKDIPDVIFTYDHSSIKLFIDIYINKFGLFNNQFEINIIDDTYENLILLQLLLRRINVNNTLIRAFFNNYSMVIKYKEFDKNNNEHIPQYIVKVTKLLLKAPTYCFTEPNFNKGVFGNVLTHQCLVETFPNKATDIDDYLRTLKFAYLYAKTVTLGLTHWSETNRVQLRNRRIGCSVSGIAQFLTKNNLHTLNQWLDTGYNVLQKWDIVYSEWLCIPRSIKTTSIKPSGTVSLLAGSTPGMHYPESRFYIRRMRLSKLSPLVEPLIKAGYTIEPAVGSENDTLVVEIPIDVGEGIRTINDVSIWEQVALAANMQRWWADNQVSCTVTFKPETEGNQIASVLDYFQYQLKGISFLPKCEYGAFPQMPYEEITEEKYSILIKNIKKVNFENNGADGVGEMYCDSESCIQNVRI